jgi:hypothetical protein
MNINHTLVKGTVKEIHPKIFCVTIDDDYDRAMLFCRYQEFYESPYKQFRGKYFTLTEYMRYYKNHRKEKVFTYPYDWVGYNIPSKIVSKALLTFSKGQWTEYDEIMSNIWDSCENYLLQFYKPKTKWYLIGASNKDIQTMNHEIAHGLYYTDKDYKKSCEKLLSRIKGRDYSFLKKSLLKIGYVDDDEIINDEIQAFMSTGLHDPFNIDRIKTYQIEFIKNFKKYTTL